MTNLIIAAFNQEADAIEASRKLTELESIGDITIYERIVFKKNAEGQIQVLQGETTQGDGLTTVSGMAIGTLVGSLAGPVGLVLGMFTGTLTGAAFEMDDYGFAEDFLSKAEGQLPSGSAAVIAEVEEDDPIFINSSLASLGGKLTRTDVSYEYTKYSDEEVEEFNEDIGKERAKLKSATAEEKDKIRRKIAGLKEKRSEKIAELKEKVKETVGEIKTTARDRKIARLRSKIEKHHTKIAELEKQLQELIGQGKEEAKEVAS